MEGVRNLGDSGGDYGIAVEGYRLEMDQSMSSWEKCSLEGHEQNTEAYSQHNEAELQS